MYKRLLFLVIMFSPLVLWSQWQSAQQVLSWKAIVVQDAGLLAVPPPPDASATQQELNVITDLQTKMDAAMQHSIHYWNAGFPGYRWQRIADSIDIQDALWLRVNAYMNVAIYDATLAAWKAKYQYGRQRPSNAVQWIEPPATPSYPCDYAVAAGAASTILAYLVPDQKEALAKMADAACRSRVAAGIQYPSDVKAGYDLGVKVAMQVIERIKQDGYDKTWQGKVPKGREYYTGMIGKHDLPNMKTWVLRNTAQFRPGPPPPIEKDMQELKAYQRDEFSNGRAFKWEQQWPWGEVVYEKMLEYHYDRHALKAAYAMAVISIADYDNQMAHWDGKFTYFRARPDQYDPSFKPVFSTPPSPSYPAGHGTMAYTRAAVLSYLFPYNNEQFYKMAAEANFSRFEAGVHYKTDNAAGEALGRKVGAEVVKWAKEMAPGW